MIAKKRPESKIPTTKTNTNKKRVKRPKATKQYSSSFQETNMSKSGSFLNRNEYIMIILSALCLTLIIFYFFFRVSDSKVEGPGTTNDSIVLSELEKRLENIEKAVNSMVKDDSQVHTTSSVKPLAARVTRLETAFTVKFESLTEKLESIEKKLALLERKIKTTGKGASVSKTKPKSKKSSSSIKVSKKKATKAPIFHTVKKGDTFYSISKKYKISVDKLLKLNKMTKKDKIYPGTNLIIR